MPAMAARKLSTMFIDISTGDSSVVGSQTAARDNIQTLDSGKFVCRKKSTSETIVKTGWSGHCTFAKYYKKSIQNHGELAEALLDSTQPG